MEYKILEKNGVENENVDGAEFNNFCAGDRDGIVEGVLNECKVILPSSNSIEISTGEIIIKGFRLKITSPYNYSFVANAGVDTKYHIVAVLNLNANRDVSINILCKTETPLIKDDIFKNEFGVYELEIVKFTHTKNGIENVVEMLDIINGGGSSGFDIGNVETEILNAGETPQVDVKNVSRDGKTVTDFKFSIPKSYALGETSDTAFAGNRGVALENGKVDKIVPDGNFAYVYAQTATGKETKIKYQTSLGINSSTIPIYRLRTEYPAWGTTEHKPTLISGMPENDYEVTPKKWVEDRLSGKVDKKTVDNYKAATGNEVLIYGVSSDGNECVFKGSGLADYGLAGTFPIRGTYGLLYSPDIPEASTNPKALTNRAYVDAQKVYRHNFNIESDNGMWGHVVFEVLSTKSTPLDWEDLRGRTAFGIGNSTDMDGSIEILRFDAISNEVTVYLRRFSDATISTYALDTIYWKYITDTVTEL